MNTPSPGRSVPVFWDTLTILVFLALLWLPTADSLFKLDRAEEPQENRLPARWPAGAGLARSREFLAGVESFFNDHFGFRKRLVGLNHQVKGQWFGDPSSKTVLLGRDGWLFYSGDRMLANYTGSDSWTPQQLEDWRRLLEGRRDWLRARGAQYLLVLPPDKHRVYPEHLPDWLQPGDKPSKIQQLLAYLRKHSTVEALDLRQPLIDAKPIRTLYLKTDTHWNAFGGFVACRALIQALARQQPGLEPLPFDLFDWNPAPLDHTDLSRMLGLPGAHPETESVTGTARRPLPPLQVQFDPARFPHSGTTETRPCFTVNPQASGKVMIFHDSFACVWYWFLGQHFREVLYLWQYNWDPALIEREKPDLVIDEILERFFNQMDPAEMMRKDNLPRTGPAAAASP
jgi:alginate O-acetyltransferase complex protein AlgJ